MLVLLASLTLVAGTLALPASAQGKLEQAQRNMQKLQKDHEELLAKSAKEQERLERRFEAAKEVVADSGGPVVTNGVACPVGRPHSFIDSWGFARSGGRRHQGTDIMAAHGTPAYAPVSGVIVSTDPNSLGGIVYWLDGDDGYTYYGAHLQQVLVSTGQRVAAGDKIGLIGSTGNASAAGPHLHFERHVGSRSGTAINPYPFVAQAC